MRIGKDSITITGYTFRSLQFPYSPIGHHFRHRFLSVVYGVEYSRVLYVISTAPFGQCQTGSPTKARELCPYVVSVETNPAERGEVLHRASCSTVPTKRYARNTHTKHWCATAIGNKIPSDSLANGLHSNGVPPRNKTWAQSTLLKVRLSKLMWIPQELSSVSTSYTPQISVKSQPLNLLSKTDLPKPFTTFPEARPC